MNIGKPITTAAAIAALLLAYGIVGTMDYEDAVAADHHYTEMVCAGYWPDYEGRRPDCSASRYQYNGAVRVRCERPCAESIVAIDPDWAHIVE